MSNTIRRPRKRPRVRSCSFRTLGWLIRREAAWNIARGSEDELGARYSRRIFAMRTTPSIERSARLWIRHFPQLRYYP